MLLEMSTQSSMLVSTRLVRGALNCWGPARITITAARIRAGTDSASPSPIAQARPEDWPPWSIGRATRPLVRRQIQAISSHGDDQQNAVRPDRRSS